MKKIIIVLIITIFSLTSCSLPIIVDKFDGSKSVVLDLTEDMDKIESYIIIERFVFIRNLDKNNIAGTPYLVFSFRTPVTDYKKFHGNTVEFNIDGTIFPIKAKDIRESNREGFNIGNIVVMLPDNVISSLGNAKKILFRIYTTDVYGESSNSFEVVDYRISDVKKMMQYKHD